jgi:glycosyltransferase involved in cell wall biosynthesis
MEGTVRRGRFFMFNAILPTSLTLDILICTIDDRIGRVVDVLLPPMEGVRWVVSMQYTDERMLERVPTVLRERTDVTLCFLPGRGLCRNRNHALRQAQGDIVLIADDDCRYTAEGLQSVVRKFEMRPDVDIICFAAESHEGVPLKAYPATPQSYETARKEGYFPASVEMSMRRGLGILFDERFGLGSERLCAGEEEVFMKDATSCGYRALVCPTVIVRTCGDTTGSRFVGNRRMQLTKGATFRYVFGTYGAIWRTVKEAGWWLVKEKANPIPILYNMLRGIWILQ